MDFEDTAEEAAYRATVRAWLKDNAPPPARAGENFDPEDLAAGRAWLEKKLAAGYLGISWPKEWGGQGGTSLQNVIFNQEEGRYLPPDRPIQAGLHICVTTVAKFGSAADRERFIPRALRGLDLWCQLFSEPAGGSDLAAARTRAVPAGDGSGDWIVNGQKIWTTRAQFSDYGILLCRTDPDVPKHRGLTMFWVDMKAPGVEVRPIHQMSGGANFNEVFFTDVRISDAQRLGELGEGWKVAMATLSNERLSTPAVAGARWRHVLDVASRTLDHQGQPLIANPVLRDKIAEWYILAEGLKHTRNRTLTALSRGETPGPQGSFSKLVAANLQQDLANTAVEMLGEFGLTDDPDLAPLNASFQESLMFAPALRIAGGTDEILRNVIAERILGLPAEIRVDKGVPFKDLSTGGSAKA